MKDIRTGTTEREAMATSISSPLELATIEARARAMRAACLRTYIRDLLARLKASEGKPSGQLEHAA